jgi:hypothetical protein
MSAFVIDRQTMDRVVSGICARDRSYGQITRTFAGFDTAERKNGTEIGRQLFTLNIEAVTQRYPDCADDPSNLPGPQDAARQASDYLWGGSAANDQESMIKTMKAMQCLRYQCSEGDVPETTGLYRELCMAIGKLAENIVRKMPTYEAAEWGR